MWTIDTYWFDVTVVMTIFAVGNILFGRFEEHKPRSLRLLKVAIILAIVLLTSMTLGRIWAYSLLSLPILAAVWIHLIWLPKHGINGWTAEPRDMYLALVTYRSSEGKKSSPRYEPIIDRHKTEDI